MCQPNTHSECNEQKELVIEDVGLVKPKGDKILVISIYGAEEIVDAKIKEIDLLHHKVILEKVEGPRRIA